MKRSARTCGVMMSIIAAIGCGGGKPQDASAKRAQAPAAAMQLAQAPDGAAAPAAAQGSSTIHGIVKFTGTAPTQERIKMDADPQCLMQHKEPVQKPEIVVGGNGGLQHVFVYVKGGLEGKSFPAPTQPVVFDQHGCMYNPRILGIQVGQPLEIRNSDATLHNVNCKPTKSKAFNIAQPTQGMKSTKQFTAPEIMVKCACNVHPWMAAYIGVVEHPYFSTTDEQGSFTLANLPAGQYTIEAWHEKLGTKTEAVTVGDGETKELSFEFTGQ